MLKNVIEVYDLATYVSIFSFMFVFVLVHLLFKYIFGLQFGPWCMFLPVSFLEVFQS